MKYKKIYYALGGVAVVGLGYLIYKKITDPTIKFGEFDDNVLGSPSIKSDALPLKRGSKGENVKKLQRFLVAEGYNIGDFGINKDGVDGDFGSLTEKAVLENQKPFATFKSFYPKAVAGQVSTEFFNTNIKGKY